MRSQITWIASPFVVMSLFVGITRASDESVDAQIATHISKLGIDDIQQREDAYIALKQLGESARGPLQKALESPDVDVQFGARRLLEALEESPDFRRRRGAPGASPFGARPSLPRLKFDPSAETRNDELRRWQDDLEQWNAEMNSWIEQLMQQSGGSWSTTLPPEARSTSSRSSMEVDADGHVKVRVIRDDDGNQVTEEYEADSIEEFQRQYPEVARGVGLGGNSPLSGFGQPRLGRSNPFDSPFFSPTPRANQPEPATPQDGPRLGVQVRSDDTSGDTRLVVVSVGRGSLADQIGIEPNDTILKVSGREIHSPEDVREALLSLKDQEQPTVTVERRGATVKLTPDAI